MITHVYQGDGTLRKLDEEERRRVNSEVLGLSPIKQAFIEAIESGEIDGDVVDSGNKSPDRPG